MDFYKISDYDKLKIEPELKRIFPDRQYKFELKHWHANRYIQLSTPLKDGEIHYEYIQGYVELHLEGKYSNYKYNTVWRKLLEASQNNDKLSWHNWSSRNRGRCRYNLFVESYKDIIYAFQRIAEIFDPVLKPFDVTEQDSDIIIEQMERNEVLPNVSDMGVDKLTYYIESVRNIPFNDLVIPEYQRPYKWGINNVNQLINDIIAFKKCKEYRLGTLVLHENNIVDGQQRIVTLSLLLYALFRKQEISDLNPFQDVQDKIKTFWKRTQFKNSYSIAHVRENISAINERLEDLDSDFLDFLLNNCQFVIVRLPKISEAFQFFDSQNARGKDLQPHDLLKAFHLREIENLTKNDNENVTFWQEQQSEYLVDLFLTLYRIKEWGKSNSARQFTKRKIGTFKGISLNDNRYPFYMQQIVCHYFITAYDNDIQRKIDNSSMEFPFQLDQVCINGSRFFDMIRHYSLLYKRITDSNEFLRYNTDKDNVSAYKIIDILNRYENRNRKGDIYVRQLFNCLLMYYIDRFGFENINKVTRKIFKYVYYQRLHLFSVQLSTVDNWACNGKMFSAIRDAKTPFDIINLDIPVLTDYNDFARNADQTIKNLYFNNYE